MAYGYQPGNYSFMPGQMGQSQSFGAYGIPQAQQPTSNKLFVVSAEDALSRFAAPNSIMIYLLQDESTLFEVYTDGQGKKSIRARTLTDAAQEAPVEYATKAELEELKKAIDSIKGGTAT
nr:MAG TPA: hypothetical protein [Caudoviricetes sp.]